MFFLFVFISNEYKQDSIDLYYVCILRETMHSLSKIAIDFFCKKRF